MHVKPFRPKKFNRFEVVLIALIYNTADGDLQTSKTIHLQTFKTIVTFTVIVTLVKHSEDVHWNVRTNI